MLHLVVFFAMASAALVLCSPCTSPTLVNNFLAKSKAPIAITRPDMHVDETEFHRHQPVVKFGALKILDYEMHFSITIVMLLQSNAKSHQQGRFEVISISQKHKTGIYTCFEPEREGY